MSKLRHERHSREEAADKVIEEGEIVRFIVMLRGIIEAVLFFPPLSDSVSRVTKKCFLWHALSHGAFPTVCVTGNPKNSHLGLVAVNKCGGNVNRVGSCTL